MTQSITHVDQHDQDYTFDRPVLYLNIHEQARMLILRGKLREQNDHGDDHPDQEDDCQ